MIRLQIVLAMLLCFGTFAVAQDKTPNQGPVEPAPPKPTLDLEHKIAIRNAQNALLILMLQMDQLDAAAAKLQQKIMVANKRVVDANTEALKASGLDPDKFTLNQDTLEVTPAPATPPAPPIGSVPGGTVVPAAAPVPEKK